MEQYLRRTPLSALLDRIGGKLTIFLGGCLFFILLWGARPSSFIAGTALGALLLLLLKKGEKQRFKKREQRLRRQIGGELALERLLLTEPMRAHFEIATLLSNAYHFSLVRTAKAGVLCEVRGENVLIGFSNKHPSAAAGAQDVLSFQRQVRREKAIRGVLVLSSPADEGAKTQALVSPKVTLYGKNSLLALLGGANPATDEQLVSLGRRRRASGGSRVTLRKILSKKRAPRYALYGSLLLLLYVITGLPYYPVPGVLLCLLAALTRCVPPEIETI